MKKRDLEHIIRAALVEQKPALAGVLPATI